MSGSVDMTIHAWNYMVLGPEFKTDVVNRANTKITAIEKGSSE
jgi:hypothetical protein